MECTSQWKDFAMRKQTRSGELRRRVPAAAPVSVAVNDVEELDCCDTLLLSPDDSVLLHPHRLEQEVRNRLMSEPSLNFTSLVVRRVHDGLCLEGVLETETDNADDASSLVRRVCGATPVLNHLVVHRARALPRKG